MTEVHVAISNLIYAYFTTEIILKQLFTSVLVIIGEYSPRLRLGEYLRVRDRCECFVYKYMHELTVQ